MSNILQNGTDWLANQLQSFASKNVTCTRGSETISVSATIGQTIFRTQNDYGAEIRTESRDYLIPSAAYVFSGGQSEPNKGDVIGETIDNRTFQYEVLAPGNEPCFRFSDPYRRTLRIHTKLILMT